MSRKHALINSKNAKRTIGTTGIISSLYAYASTSSLTGMLGVATSLFIGVATTLSATMGGAIGMVAGAFIGKKISDKKKSSFYERRGWTLGGALILGSAGFLTGAIQVYEPSKEIAVKASSTIETKLSDISISNVFNTENLKKHQETAKQIENKPKDSVKPKNN